MAVLFLDEGILKRIQEVKEHAENNIYTHEELMKMQVPGYSTVEEIKQHEFLVIVPVPYRFVYTIEEGFYDGEILKIRHLSATNLRTKKVPPPFFIQTIIELLGYKKALKDCYNFFTENESIINTVEPYE